MTEYRLTTDKGIFLVKADSAKAAKQRALDEQLATTVYMVVKA